VDEDLGGAALWGAPGRWRAGVKDTLKVALPSLSLFGTNLPRALTTNTRLEKQHPTQPHHWYLGYLGTRPDRQGRGVGGALVSEVTSRCDQVGLPAYLESSKAENLGFYARLGFVEQQEVQLRNGPLLWTMWREPQTCGSSGDPPEADPKSHRRVHRRGGHGHARCHLAPAVGGRTADLPGCGDRGVPPRHRPDRRG